MQQDTLPQHPSRSSSCNPGLKTKSTCPTDLASLTFLTRPRHSTSTTAAPSKPGHLSLLFPEHSKSKRLHLVRRAEPSEASPEKNDRLSEPPESPACICSLQWGRRDGDMQQTESCVNRMLPEIGPSGVHAGCSPYGHSHPGGRILLPACTTCPRFCGEGEHGSQGAQGTELFFVCWGYKDPGHSPSWRGGTELSAGSGTLREKGCLPGHSHAPSTELQNSKLGWGGPASEELQNSPPGASQKLKKSKAAKAPRNPWGCVLALARQGWSNSWSGPPAPPKP